MVEACILTRTKFSIWHFQQHRFASFVVRSEKNKYRIINKRHNITKQQKKCERLGRESKAKHVIVCVDNSSVDLRRTDGISIGHTASYRNRPC